MSTWKDKHYGLGRRHTLGPGGVSLTLNGWGTCAVHPGMAAGTERHQPGVVAVTARRPSARLRRRVSCNAISRRLFSGEGQSMPNFAAPSIPIPPPWWDWIWLL